MCWYVRTLTILALGLLALVPPDLQAADRGCPPGASATILATATVEPVCGLVAASPVAPHWTVGISVPTAPDGRTVIGFGGRRAKVLSSDTDEDPVLSRRQSLTVFLPLFLPAGVTGGDTVTVIPADL